MASHRRRPPTRMGKQSQQRPCQTFSILAPNKTNITSKTNSFNHTIESKWYIRGTIRTEPLLTVGGRRSVTTCSRYSESKVSRGSNAGESSNGARYFPTNITEAHLSTRKSTNDPETSCRNKKSRILDMNEVPVSCHGENKGIESGRKEMVRPPLLLSISFCSRRPFTFSLSTLPFSRRTEAVVPFPRVNVGE